MYGLVALVAYIEEHSLGLKGQNAFSSKECRACYYKISGVCVYVHLSFFLPRYSARSTVERDRTGPHLSNGNLVNPSMATNPGGHS